MLLIMPGINQRVYTTPSFVIQGMDMTAVYCKKKPVTQEEPMKVITVRLTNWHIRKARGFGAGCLTDGIRYAIDLAIDNKEGK